MQIEHSRFGRRQRSALVADRSGSNVLVVTGPTAGVGKTFIAANLAGVNARAGKRVLLIDADLRHGRVASLFGLPPGAGLAHWLAGRTDATAAVRPVDVPGLHVMTAGGTLADPSELLANGRLQELLRELSPAYDLIIIDTPAILAFDDASTVAALGGSTIVVARPGPRSEEEIDDAVSVLQRSGANVAGVVFNTAPRRAGDMVARRRRVFAAC
ncbi:CpsD/CapB family tyrosine-protein kinase [Caballeronia sp. LZ016]|uniref:CpsD/CapB family tyrosine-protein kinase n=1 Tax=Caballeronia sp. LZ016 TaxID=3038554 RepID=UPI00285EE4D9|nr:CpsD/CapB family tyrosine-protein kinase [Caballeronia sp. LZ016]MDR5741507.1 CpsD/CapB family tyrosine-protein kinase [Caballeronia sp. LZ016]